MEDENRKAMFAKNALYNTKVVEPKKQEAPFIHSDKKNLGGFIEIEPRDLITNTSNLINREFPEDEKREKHKFHGLESHDGIMLYGREYRPRFKFSQPEPQNTNESQTDKIIRKALEATEVTMLENKNFLKKFNDLKNNPNYPKVIHPEWTSEDWKRIHDWILTKTQKPNVLKSVIKESGIYVIGNDTQPVKSISVEKENPVTDKIVKEFYENVWKNLSDGEKKSLATAIGYAKDSKEIERLLDGSFRRIGKYSMRELLYKYRHNKLKKGMFK